MISIWSKTWQHKDQEYKSKARHVGSLHRPVVVSVVVCVDEKDKDHNSAR